jgi:hypothetical protein
MDVKRKACQIRTWEKNISWHILHQRYYIFFFILSGKETGHTWYSAHYLPIVPAPDNRW